MESVFSYAGINLSYASIAILVSGVLIFILVMRSGKFRKVIWNFSNTPYKHVELLHDGIKIRDYYILESEIKDGKYKDGDRTFNFSEIFNPIPERANVKRYTFLNDNTLPLINATDGISTIKGINSYEVMSKTKDGKLFVISNHYILRLLDTHFVEKIKKEAENTWDKLFDMLKTPSGAIIVIAICALIGFGFWINR